jgi:hypothetical protein
MVDGEMVVACSPTTVVEEAEANLRTDAGGGGAALMLREGHFEIAVHAQENEVDEPPSEGPEATLIEATLEPGRVGTTAPDENWRADGDVLDSKEPVTIALSRSVALGPADPPTRRQSRPAVPDDFAGDAPTRFGPVSEGRSPLVALGSAATSVANSAQSADSLGAVKGTRPQKGASARRVALRCVALVAMLAVVLLMALRARRSAQADVVRRSHPHVVASATRGEGLASPAAEPGDGPRAMSAASPSSALPPAPSASPALAWTDRTVAGSMAGGGKTKARLAADALASGAYGDALQLYTELAAEKDANPAYEQAVRVLRTRLAAAPERP